MILDTLHYVYGLNTSSFYTETEAKLERKMLQARSLHRKILDKLKNGAYQKPHTATVKFLIKTKQLYKDKLKREIDSNIGLMRTVRPGELNIWRQIAIFDSNLTRCLGLKEREINTEIVVIEVFFFGVAENLIKNGFMMNGQRYAFFSASAGQIRTKKFVAVREDLLKENWNELTAGLTIEKINEQGGINVNKYLAYLALCNSATQVWQNFDIDKTIVIDDFENIVHTTVDFVDDKTYKIVRQDMDIPITHTDGCGMMLPSVSKRNFMVRLPWVKGLLSVFDFRKFMEDNNCIPIIKDIYGVEHDVIKEDIQIIFTKSQFKCWKYFTDWNQYKTNFKAYGCTAGKCNDEEAFVPKSKLTYQMLQTLYDMSDDELRTIASKSFNEIHDICTDMSSMLEVLGATDNNTKISGFQKCLRDYPELLGDSYTRETLKDIKTSLETDLWSARLKLDCKYSFVIPDLYAACEYWFLHINNPVGLLKDGEVSCRLYGDNSELDCLRSPHLYIEHSIQRNVVNSKTKEWFKTDAIFASCHSAISKVLQFDK